MNSYKSKVESGFTLLEMCIVTVITGALLVGAIQAYRVYAEKQKVEQMKSYMADVSQSLKSFPTLMYDHDANVATAEVPYNRMPCPAPLDGTGLGNDFSSENINIATGDCQGVLSIPVGSGNVLIGKLPAASLRVPNDYMKDAHGNYLIYAVTEAATKEATYGTTAGLITIKEEVVNEGQIAGAPLGKIVDNGDKTNIYYAVISTGESGDGAIDFSGNVIRACKPGSKEAENCIDPTSAAANDATFMASVYSSKPGTAKFYDDHVRYAASLPTVVVEEPPTCEQYDTMESYTGTCPTGWEKSPVIGNATLEIPATGSTITSSPSSPSSGSSVDSLDNLINSLNSGTSLGSVADHITPDSPMFLGSLKRYYNIDPDTGDYYFSNIKTPHTIEGPPSATPNHLLKPVPCRKKSDNTAKTRCFSEKVTATFPYNGNAKVEGYESACPSGYRMVSLDKTYTFHQSKVGSGPLPATYKLTCGK